jgi:RNA 3'-terminal phosphate cyclase (ATP)
MSPSYDYVHDVWLPTLARMGVHAELSLVRSGWFPVGQGEVRLRIAGTAELLPLHVEHRSPLRAVTGRALAANLPAHICERMASRTRDLLEQAGMAAEIEAAVVEAACPGAGMYLTAHYENSLAGFSAQGKRGKPAERVAEEACSALLHHHRSCAALEQHLADQLILPAALCRGESVFSVERITPHLVTNAWVVERFELARIDIAPVADGTGFVKISANR